MIPLIDPKDLTEEQRFAIAYLAGCETDITWRGGAVVMTTKNRVGISVVNGRYQVSELKLPEYSK